MIRCGWCGNQTANTDRCTSCGHPDPTLPYVQRGEAAPVPLQGRPVRDRAGDRRRVTRAERELRSDGRAPTVEAIAEHLGVSPRTVRRWRELA